MVSGLASYLVNGLTGRQCRRTRRSQVPEPEPEPGAASDMATATPATRGRGLRCACAGVSAASAMPSCSHVNIERLRPKARGIKCSRFGVTTTLMKCWNGDLEAKAVCVFCGRGICATHRKAQK